MKLNKRFVMFIYIVLMVCLLACVFTACGDKKGNADSDNSSNNSSSGNGSKVTYARLSTTSNMIGAGTYTRFSNASKESGSRVTLTASAYPGYKFVGWYKGSTCLSSSTYCTFTMPSYDVRIIAKFEIQYYNLTTTTNMRGAGSYSQYSNAPRQSGSRITLTASANKGYKFVGWYKGSTRLSSDTLYTFTMPSYDVTITAKFERIF